MRSRRPPRRSLNPEAIVDAAMAVLDEGGVDSLNMRAVADRLGTGPSSLYAHFAGKDELLAAMIDRIAGELPLAEIGKGPGRSSSRPRSAPSARAWPPTATSPSPRSATSRPARTPCAGSTACSASSATPGLPDQVIAYAVDILPLYANATAFEESLYRAKDLPDSGEQYIAELRQYFASLPVDRFPHIVAMAVPLTSEATPDARFEFGLDALVRGIETMKSSQ